MKFVNRELRWLLGLLINVLNKEVLELWESSLHCFEI